MATSIVSGKLTLNLDISLIGTSTITVRSTDAGGLYVDESFDVIVLAHDTTAPISNVVPLPTNATSLAIPISFVGTDPTGSIGSQISGVLEFELFVAMDSGAFNKFITVPASSANAIFLATSNHSYFFRSLARDVDGNTEFKSGSVPDTQITVGDLDPPATSISSVSSNSLGTFTISLIGSDSGGGVLRFFDVYVAIDNGGLERIGSVGAGVPNSQGIYSGSMNYQGRTDGILHKYRFFSVGRDSAGNIEDAPGPNSDILVARTFAAVGLRATGIDVQLGSLERSFIRNVDILFNSESNLDELLGAGRIVSERFALNASNVTPGTGIPVTNYTSNKVTDRIRLDFGANGITGTRNSNAGDGFYRVRVDVNGDGDFSDLEDAAFEFHRILGDAMAMLWSKAMPMGMQPT